jgi:hypothetical protein
MTTKQKRKAAGRKGGLRTVEKHGREYMSEIGKRGAATLWRRYHLRPVDVSGWALVDRETGKVKAVWG